MELLCRRLRVGGHLEIATDHVGYAEWIDERLATVPGLENALAPDRFVREMPGRVPTAYELMWREERRALHFWRYRKTRS